MNSYEGNLPYVFISYAHLDVDRVLPIIQHLKSDGYRIWYDQGIEAGTAWAKNIAEHLGSASCIIAFISQNYISSENCMDEIEHAKNKGKKTLIIYLDNITVPEWFEMRHNRTQAIFCAKYNTESLFYQRIFEAHVLDICKGEKEANVSEDTEANFDDELDEAFRVWFDDKSERKNNMDIKSNDSSSPLQQVILKKMEDKAINDFFENNANANEIIEAEEQEVKSLIPCTEKVMGRCMGRHFSIIDKPDTKTLVYEVYKCVDSLRNLRYFDVEPLIFDEELQADGATKRTYYIEDPQEDGNQLIILTFIGEAVLINNGLLLVDEVHLSRKPTYFRFSEDKYSNAEINTGYDFTTGYYDINTVPAEGIIEINSSTTHKACARLDAKVIIIDPQKKIPVLRKIEFDKELGEYKAFVEIEANKNYFAFQLRSNEDDSYENVLSNIELGRFYRDGRFGYKKNLLKAIELFEKENTAEGYYEISQIFTHNVELDDKVLAEKYLEMSANSGYLLAILDLAILYIFKKNKKKEGIELINKAIGENSAVAKFLMAALIELQIEKNDDDSQCFELYYAAAAAKYKPAQSRLSSIITCGKWDAQISRENAWEYFKNTKGTGEIEFCLGSSLMWNWDIGKDNETGLLYLKKAIAKGNISAANDLYNFYLNQKDPKYLKYARCVIKLGKDARFLNEFCNNLLDIEIHSDESDIIAKTGFERAIELDANYASATNNLGWMYQNARGTKKDYKKALKLFEHAAQSGCQNAYFHLGEIYEIKGDTEKALYWYTEGSNLGNEKCMKKLFEN